MNQDTLVLCRGTIAAALDAIVSAFGGVCDRASGHVAETNLVDETMHRRLIPGDGDIGVEVISDQPAARPFEETARRCAEATRSILKNIAEA